MSHPHPSTPPGVPALPDAPASPTAAPASAGSRSPGSVWLCAPGPHDEDPPTPRWASQLVEAFSAPGDRIVIRGLSGYLGMAGEMAALTAAAHHAGRRALALLPTRSAAYATRDLVAIGPSAPRPTDLDRTAHPALIPDVDRAADVDLIGRPFGRRAGIDLVPWAVDAGGPRAEVGPRVEIGRLRPGAAPASADLLVVLTGPVAPGARAVRRGLSARLVGRWARVLRPGGLLAVLAPPPIGRAAQRSRGGGGELVRAVQDAGLIYTQHVVLVHTSVVDGHLAAPVTTRRPHAPFRAVHTDLWIFSHYPSAVPLRSTGDTHHRDDEQETA